MRSKLVAFTVLLAVFTAGCTSAPGKPQTAPPVEAGEPSVNDYHWVDPPATPRHGERVSEQSLPSGLSGWSALTPDVPGGISSVVGDSLYVLASPGRINDDAHTFTISDVTVMDNHVEVEAYLVHTKAVSNQGLYYPKDYAKIDYMGTASELPVVLDILYGDAAYAYVKEGQYDHIDPKLLPASLQDWNKPIEENGASAKTAVVGDFLYVMVNPEERLRDHWLRFEDAALTENQVNVVVTYEQVDSSLDWPPYSAPIFARVPFQGSDPPPVEVEYREYHRPQ